MGKSFTKGKTDHKKRANRLSKSGLNFLSGTICPAPYRAGDDELETIESAVQYYKDAGLDAVVIQKKLMGSRLTLHLYHDVEKCYAITRNGFRIDANSERGEALNIEAIFKENIKRFNTGFNWDFLVVDGELTPWSALGRGLIEKGYKEYGEIVDVIINNASLDSLGDSPAGIEARTYVQNLKEDMANFNHQIDIFGAEGTPEFHPFAILKYVYRGREVVSCGNNILGLSLMNGIGAVCSIEYAERFRDSDFYKSAVEEELEGFVVKPVIYGIGDGIDWKNVVPYLKVRNKNYLAITYGPDYLRDYRFNVLAEKKSVMKKMRASIIEYHIGKRLLEIPHTMADSKNRNYVDLIEEALVSFEQTDKLDPRL